MWISNMTYKTQRIYSKIIFKRKLIVVLWAGLRSIATVNCSNLKCVNNDKGKVHPRTDHEGAEGEYRYSYTLSLTSALDGVVVNATPRPPYPRERPGTHCIGGWVCPRAGLNRCGKSRPHWNSIPRPPKPLASRYTDWAIPAHLNVSVWVKIRKLREILNVDWLQMSIALFGVTF